ncbi:toxin-activating lysine-acyltransferase [Pseudomonas sp. EA_15y_Pfl2_R67]|uniref:toxin-activating lysine-acyltransferase n=1 Tax=Pseudomonas sp. EA_15y_Pfl2_R67 TaxID=3088687 RepID=UPI0030DC4D07
MYSTKLFTVAASAIDREKAQIYGFVYMIGVTSGYIKKDKFFDFNRWLSQAIDYKQILLVFNKASIPLGFVTWANINDETQQRLMSDKGFSIHPLEWNEGENTWIMDFYCPKGGARQMSRLIRDRLREEGVSRVFWKKNHNINSMSLRKTIKSLSIDNKK